MKYRLEITVNLPRKRVVELFDNPDNLKEWQPGLKSFEPLSDNLYEEGAKTKLLYQMGKKEVAMIETIVLYNPPDRFSAIYEAKNVWNRCDNWFLEKDETTTQWLFESDFRCKGFVWALTLLCPWMFKKQSLDYMNQFKTFAENA